MLPCKKTVHNKGKVKNAHRSKKNHKKASTETFLLQFINRASSPYLVCNHTYVMESINPSYYYLFCTHRSTFQADGARPPRSVLKQD